MGRSTVVLMLIAVFVAGWVIFARYEIRGVNGIQFVRRDGSGSGNSSGLPAARDKETIRIASFNMQVFGPAKAENPAVLEVLARIIREFDVVAVQEVRSERPDALRKLLEQVNSAGAHYSMLIGPRVGRTKSREQFVYIFDETTLEADRSATYTVDDPDDLLHRPPFVGWFRTRGPSPEEAFTFTLVNVHTDPDEISYEARTLDDVFFSVRDDGREEDDLVMLGDFNMDDQQLSALERISGLVPVIAGAPTNTRQTKQYDNLIFQLPATSEYAGRSGVFDFMREFNLTMEQALQVSDHLPVWAEFYAREGGDVPSIAAVSDPSGTR